MGFFDKKEETTATKYYSLSTEKIWGLKPSNQLILEKSLKEFLLKNKETLEEYIKRNVDKQTASRMPKKIAFTGNNNRYGPRLTELFTNKTIGHISNQTVDLFVSHTMIYGDEADFFACDMIYDIPKIEFFIGENYGDMSENDIVVFEKIIFSFIEQTKISKNIMYDIDKKEKIKRSEFEEKGKQLLKRFKTK